MKISFDKKSKEEKRAEKLQKEELAREAARDTANNVMPLFIEKAKIKLIVIAVLCLLIAILNEFVFKIGSDTLMILIYVVIAGVAYGVTRKEWRDAKAEAEH